MIFWRKREAGVKHNDANYITQTDMTPTPALNTAFPPQKKQRRERSKHIFLEAVITEEEDNGLLCSFLY